MHVLNTGIAWWGDYVILTGGLQIIFCYFPNVVITGSCSDWLPFQCQEYTWTIYHHVSGQEERPPRGQLWMEQCLTPLKYWPI